MDDRTNNEMDGKQFLKNLVFVLVFIFFGAFVMEWLTKPSQFDCRDVPSLMARGVPADQLVNCRPTR